MGLGDGFMRSVATLLGGTMVAQALAALALPLLTRLYTPAEFSVLAVYASLLAILSVGACLRFEIAIPVPELPEEAARLLVLALTVSVLLSGLVACAVLAVPEWIANQLGTPALAPWLWLLPLGMWLASSGAAVQYWATRHARFREIANARVAQSAGGAATQAALGMAGTGPGGLLLGHLVSASGALAILAGVAWRDTSTTLRSTTWRLLRQTFRTYVAYPRYSTPDALANALAAHLPIVVIASLALGPEAGYLVLAMKLMAMPIALFGGAVAQVFLSRAPAARREGRLDTLTSQVLSRLLRTGTGPLLCAGLAAPPLFELVFGPEWRRSGDLVAWMTPWFVLQMLSSPVSMVMQVAERHRTMLLINLAGLVLRTGAVCLAFLLAPGFASESYAISGCVFYLLCSIVFYRTAGLGRRTWLAQLRLAWPFLIAWTAAGAMIRFAADVLA